jgi:hypothetical protein
MFGYDSFIKNDSCIPSSIHLDPLKYNDKQCTSLRFILVSRGGGNFLWKVFCCFRNLKF